MSFFKRIGRIFGGGGGGQNPAQSAMPYLNQIPGAVGEYYKPFITAGQQAQEVVNPIYGRMSQDPNEFLNQIMRNYTPSEGYRFKERMLTRAAQNDAAQGGFLGTPTSQLQQADIVRGLLGDEMQQYLGNILGIQGAGLQGQENRIGRGFQASTGYGDILGSNLGQQAGLAFQGQAQQNANRLSRRNSFLNFLGQGLGAGARLYTGGM